MTDHLTPAKRSWNMSRILSKNTKPEINVRRLLQSRGLLYRVHRSDFPGKSDILNQRKKAIFVNGFFWHRHGCKNTTIPKTNIKFWENKFERTVVRDKNNIDFLNKVIMENYRYMGM